MQSRKVKTQKKEVNRSWNDRITFKTGSAWNSIGWDREDLRHYTKNYSLSDSVAGRTSYSYEDPNNYGF